MKEGIIYLWSKDRACQLDTLLTSMKDTILMEEFDVNVLFTHQNEDFAKAYDKVITKYPEISFEYQYDAKPQMINCISEYKYTCILTDDSLVHTKPPTSILDKMDNIGVFSLRLGLNTIMQNHFVNEYQPILNNYVDEGETIHWNFSQIRHYYNYGYPFSMDGHVYHNFLLLPLLERISFHRPPELEGNLLPFRNQINQHMRAFKHSCIVNIPLNTISQNTQASGPSLEYLNKQYLEGKMLQYIDEPIIGCHQSVNWELVNG